MTDIDAIRKTKRYRATANPKHWLVEDTDGDVVEFAVLTSALSAYDAKCEELAKLLRANESQRLHIAKRDQEVTALLAERDAAVRAIRSISEEVAFVGCEGPDDRICIEAERAREDWCPFCRIGDTVRAALAPPTEQPQPSEREVLP